MKIDFAVDSHYVSLNINSTKPLLKILIEDLDKEYLHRDYSKNHISDNVVLLNGKAVFSALVPAFKLKDSIVVTYEEFRNTRNCREIENAYKKYSSRPCSSCVESKTLLLESIISGYEKDVREINTDEIIQELLSSNCSCVESRNFLNIAVEVIKQRRKYNENRT